MNSLVDGYKIIYLDLFSRLLFVLPVTRIFSTRKVDAFCVDYFQ